MAGEPEGDAFWTERGRIQESNGPGRGSDTARQWWLFSDAITTDGWRKEPRVLTWFKKTGQTVTEPGAPAGDQALWGSAGLVLA